MLSTVREKVSAFKQYLAASKKRTFTFTITICVLIALPLLVIVSQEQQQIRQRASAPQVCSSADSIPTCSSNNPANNTCDSEGTKCKIDNTIYECVQNNNNNDFN